MKKQAIEEWKPVVGHKHYLISSLGNCISIERSTFDKNGNIHHCRERKLIPHNNGNGYMAYNIDGKHKYIHRLIAEAFLPNPQNKKEVDHIDGNRANNILSNIRWATRTENLRNENTHPNMRKGQKGCSVVMLDSYGNYIRRFEYISQAAEYLNVAPSSIKCAMYESRKTIKTCKGFIFVKEESYNPSVDYCITLDRKYLSNSNVLSNASIALYKDNFLKDVFPSATIAANLCHIDRHTIAKHIKNGQKLDKKFRNSEYCGYILKTYSKANDTEKKEIETMYYNKYIKAVD